MHLRLILSLGWVASIWAVLSWCTKVCIQICSANVVCTNPPGRMTQVQLLVMNIRASAGASSCAWNP